jgi:hypothetical protein
MLDGLCAHSFAPAMKSALGLSPRVPRKYQETLTWLLAAPRMPRSTNNAYKLFTKISQLTSAVGSRMRALGFTSMQSLTHGASHHEAPLS